ncbi:MAG TPA: aminomethyltransferase family protein, partial [Candidatus Manganitrophaceae bacterium]|nr:aminomethyltransferase family protein [Candidatus Manganitrophaceae bacterium]
MPQLILHARHEQKGAQYALYGGWTLPEHYGDPLSEYRAVRERVGMADISYQGMFLITGRDRLPFLQNLVSNDLKLLTERKGVYATLLTHKGRVLSDIYLYPLPDALFMEVEGTIAENTRQHLMRFKLASQVKIERPPWGALLLSGPHARALLEKATGGPLPPLEEKALFQKEIEGIPTTFVKRSITGEEDFRLYFPEEGLEKLWERLLSAGSEYGISPVGQAALETLRVEAGRPRYGTDIDEHIIPIEAGLEAEAISYTKGCYPGQEVIARIQTYGHVNKHLSGLILEGKTLPQKGDKVFQDEKELGWITGATLSPFVGKVI